MLPNFICLGAQKAGTTSLWKLLNVHPDIFLASPRETQFFHDDLRYSEGLQAYEARHFSGWANQTAVGEKCPEYLYVPEVPFRIRQTLGTHARFIVTLRSPAQRAWSHYRHNVNALRESRTFEQALAEESALLNTGRFVAPPFGYIGRGLYAEQIRRYLKYFSREQFLFVDFENDICSDQRSLALRLYMFLGVRPLIPSGLPYREGRPKLEELTAHYNQDASDPTEHFIHMSRRRPSGFVRRLIQRFRGRDSETEKLILRPSPELIQFVETFQELQSRPSRLTAEQETEINRRYFRSDLSELSDLVPVDISAWAGQASETTDESGTVESATEGATA